MTGAESLTAESGRWTGTGITQRPVCGLDYEKGIFNCHCMRNRACNVPNGGIGRVRLPEWGSDRHFDPGSTPDSSGYVCRWDGRVHEQPVVQPEAGIDIFAADAMHRDKLSGQTVEQVREKFSPGKNRQELGPFSFISLNNQKQILCVPNTWNDSPAIHPGPYSKDRP